MWLFASFIEHTGKVLDIAMNIPDVIKLIVLIGQFWGYIKSFFKRHSAKPRLKQKEYISHD